MEHVNFADTTPGFATAGARTRSPGNLHRFLAAGAALLMPHVHSAAAQVQDHAVEDDVLVVTARHRNEILQEVPETIHAFNEGMIENTGLESIADITMLVPNLGMVSSLDAASVLMNIRGIGQVRNGEAPMAILIDGVQLSSPDLVRQPLFDLQSVEVLKGPQGALYGRNAIGGAIIIHTKTPGNEPSNTIVAGYAEGDKWTGQLISSGPIVADKLFYRLAVDGRTSDGQIRNVTTNTLIGGGDEINFRGKLLFKASEDLTFDLRASYGYVETKGGYVPLPDGDPNNTSIPVQSRIPTDASRKFFNGAFKIDFHTSIGTFSSVTDYSYKNAKLHQQLGGGIPNPTRSAFQRRPARSFSEDFRLTSDSDGSLRYTIGVYYLHNEPDITTILNILDANYETAAQIPVADTRNTSNAYAGYAQINYDIQPDLELTLAGRYDYQKVRQVDLLRGAAVTKISFDAFQPKASIAYKFQPGSSVYLTYAQGFRSGGLNAPSIYFPLVYEDERTKNLEAGLKVTAFDRALRFDVAGYYTWYRDQAAYTLAPNAVQGITSVPSTTMYGIDASADLKLSRAFLVSASFGWNHSRINDFDGTSKYVGNKSPLNYEFSYNLGAQYTLPVGDASLVGRIDYSRKSGMYWHLDNADKQAPVDIVNARITAEIEKWRLSLFLDNVFNEKWSEEFCAREFCGGVVDLKWPSQPRQIGASVRYDF